MSLLYKHFGCAGTVFLLGLLALFALPQAKARAAASPLYTIEGIEVDITADNAVKAREKALDEAQLKAYEMLAQRLLSEQDLATFTVPDINTVSALVQDFEVTNEQLSAVRYKGTYTIRFRPNALKTKFQSEARHYSDVQEQPVLVLPYYQAGGQTLLWNETNPWMNAWRRAKPDRYALVPTIVPLGDAADVTQISENNAGTFDFETLEALKARYSVGAVTVLTASQKEATSPLEIALSMVGEGGTAYLRTISVPPVAGETPDALYDRAVVQARAALQSDGKARRATVAPAPSSYQPSVPAPSDPYAAYSPTQNAAPVTAAAQTFNARARFSSLQDWMKLKAALERTPGVQVVLVKTLKPREALIDLRFGGDGQSLQRALQSSGIILRAPLPAQGTYGQAQPVYEIYMNAMANYGQSPAR